MEKITIIDKQWNKKREVEAEIFGKLAVHPSWTEPANDDFLTITHVPTGARLPVRSLAKKAVIACAQELSSSFDWNFDKIEDASHLKGKVIPVLEEYGIRD